MVIRAGRRHNPNVFNLQPGDLVVLGLVGLILLGPLGLSELSGRLGRELRSGGGWSSGPTERRLIAAALILASFVIALGTASR